MRRAIPILVLVFAGCDATTEGVAAYRAGRTRDAFAAFDAAVRAAGDRASPELLYDRALAALQIGERDVAEASVAEAARRGGPEFAALRDFVRGNVAFARSQLDGLARDSTIALLEDALAAWRAAAASRPDWPEARRNVERALLRLESLRERRVDGRRDDPGRRPSPPTPGRPDQPPPPPPPSERAGPEAARDVEASELSPSDVRRLFERLREKEREKLALRAQERARGGEVERDW